MQPSSMEWAHCGAGEPQGRSTAAVAPARWPQRCAEAAPGCPAARNPCPAACAPRGRLPADPGTLGISGRPHRTRSKWVCRSAVEGGRQAPALGGHGAARSQARALSLHAPCPAPVWHRGRAPRTHEALVGRGPAGEAQGVGTRHASAVRSKHRSLKAAVALPLSVAVDAEARTGLHGTFGSVCTVSRAGDAASAASGAHWSRGARRSRGGGKLAAGRREGGGGGLACLPQSQALAFGSVGPAGGGSRPGGEQVVAGAGDPGRPAQLAGPANAPADASPTLPATISANTTAGARMLAKFVLAGVRTRVGSVSRAVQMVGRMTVESCGDETARSTLQSQICTWRRAELPGSSTAPARPRYLVAPACPVECAHPRSQRRWQSQPRRCCLLRLLTSAHTVVLTLVACCVTGTEAQAAAEVWHSGHASNR